MSTNTLKQALEIVYGDIKNINKRVKNLESASAGVLYTETTKSAVAYQDNVSANACPYALLNKVGGMSYKSENLCPTATYTGIMNSTIANSIDLGNLAQGTYTISLNITVNNDNRRLVFYFYNNGVLDTTTNIVTNVNGTGAKTYTFTLDSTYTYDDVRLGLNSGTNNYSITLDSLMLNTGDTALPYQPYFEGIRDSAVSSVVSKDSNDNLLATGEIPNEIQALTGYGWGINDTCYNYIDFENKKFIQKVARVDLGTLNWFYDDRYTYSRFFSETITNLVNQITGIPNAKISNNYTLAASNGLGNIDKAYTTYNSKAYVEDSTYTTATAFKQAMSGVYLYYELATPIETDISQYIDDNSIQIEANGTITFNNTYQQAVPYEYLYLEKVGANNE